MASTKLTQEKIEKICARLVEGVSLEAASEAAGIHREYLLRLYRNGDLTRVARGLYALPGAQTDEPAF